MWAMLRGVQIISVAPSSSKEETQRALSLPMPRLSQSIPD